MEPTILQYFISQGPWAVGFIWLLYWVLKENRTREKEMREEHACREDKLYECLSELSHNYEEMAEDLNEIKRDIVIIKEEAKLNKYY